MPSYGWNKRHTTITEGPDKKTTTTVSVSRLKGQPVELGTPLRSLTALEPGGYIVFHDFEKGLIEKLQVVTGKVIDGLDPRAEWQHLGEVSLMEFALEGKDEEEDEGKGNVMWSLHSLGISPYPNSNQYGTDTLSFLLREGQIIPI